MQEGHNYIADAMALRLSCTNPSIWCQEKQQSSVKETGQTLVIELDSIIIMMEVCNEFAPYIHTNYSMELIQRDINDKVQQTFVFWDNWPNNYKSIQQNNCRILTTWKNYSGKKNYIIFHSQHFSHTIYDNICHLIIFLKHLSDQLTIKVKCSPVWEYIRHLIPTYPYNTHLCHIASKYVKLLWVNTVCFVDQMFAYTNSYNSVTATSGLTCSLIYRCKVYFVHMQIYNSIPWDQCT